MDTKKKYKDFMDLAWDVLSYMDKTSLEQPSTILWSIWPEGIGIYISFAWSSFIYNQRRTTLKSKIFKNYWIVNLEQEPYSRSTQ